MQLARGGPVTNEDTSSSLRTARVEKLHVVSQAVEQSSESEAGSGGGGYLPASMGLLANKGARSRGRYWLKEVLAQRSTGTGKWNFAFA